MSDRTDATPWRPSEIRRRYASGERDFRDLDIADPAPFRLEDGRFVSVDEPESFRGAALDDADFGGAFIVADFTGAGLARCRFVGANVKTCVFDQADLTSCDFSDAALDGATFERARLVGAVFTGASVQGHRLRTGELPSAGRDDEQS